MSAEENKTKQRRVWEEVFNKGNLGIISEYFAPGYTYRSPLGMEVKGPEGFKQMVAMMRTALPDMHVTIDDMFAEGDRVATRFTITGTSKGEMMGIPPTGNKITVSGIVITRWAGGKEEEAWEYIDTAAFFQQLGIKPPAQ
jgi:steroid delta-isomerase-like uncharacterized protein